MCIALFKLNDTKCPSIDILRNCWDSNPDGAGFAFPVEGNQVKIVKGFMHWQDFEDAWEKYKKHYDLDHRSVLLHFRISTGGRGAGNTHPFAIMGDTEILHQTRLITDYAVIHNGIISLTSSKARQEPNSSDTLVFCRDYMTLIAQNKQWFKRRSNIELLGLLAQSKLAIMNGRGEVIHTDGFTEDNGVWYSNTSYKTPRVRTFSSHNYTSTTCYGYLDDDLDDDYDYYYGRGYGYNGGYNGGTSNSNSYYQSGTKNAYKGSYSAYGKIVPLMRCSIGDVIMGDSIEEDCDTNGERGYALSEEGFLYELVKENGAKDNDSTSSFSFSFLGSGQFLDKNGKKKGFIANIWPNEGQFLGESYPDSVRNLYTDPDAPIDDDDMPVDLMDLGDGTYAQFNSVKKNVD